MADTSWIVGFHAVIALLKGDRPVDAVWVQQGRTDNRCRQIMAAAKNRGVKVVFVPRVKLDRIAGKGPHNGCAARAAIVDFQTLDRIVRPEGEAGRILVLDHVIDPHNVGAIIRSAAAFSVDGVVIAGPTAPPLGDVVARASAGHAERVPLVRAKVAADVLYSLRGEGYWIYGADMAGAEVDAVKSDDRWVLVVGAEDKGLRAKTRSVVDEMVSIPMAAAVESLNVSVSTGILLFALRR